jgi:hypothetical protein
LIFDDSADQEDWQCTQFCSFQFNSTRFFFVFSLLNLVAFPNSTNPRGDRINVFSALLNLNLVLNLVLKVIY